MLIGVDAINQFIIIDMLPIMNNLNTLTFENLNRIEIDNYIDYVIENIGVNLPGGVHILGFLFQREGWFSS